MTSEEFVEFIERKLEEHRISKVVPGDAYLKTAYTLFAEGKELKAAFAEAEKAIKAKRDTIEVPADLREQVESLLEEHPEIAWHQAVHAVVDPTMFEKKGGDNVDQVEEIDWPDFFGPGTGG